MFDIIVARYLRNETTCVGLATFITFYHDTTKLSCASTSEEKKK
jgi:hypothetical protein